MNDLNTLTVIKLRSGMELIGKVEVMEDEESKSQVVLITDPFQINYKISESMVPTIHFIRFMMVALADTFTIPGDEVLTFSPPREVFIKYYQQANEMWYEQSAPALDAQATTALMPETKDDLMRMFLEKLEFDPTKMQ